MKTENKEPFSKKGGFSPVRRNAKPTGSGIKQTENKKKPFRQKNKRRGTRHDEQNPASNKNEHTKRGHSFRKGGRPKTSFNKKDDSLRIIPLGGCEEVGRNMTVFEYKNDIIILDMGIQFPEEDMPGIDYIIPNIEYLKGKEKNIRGVIFSHGHLDHIGAAPILLEKLGNPLIIGRDLTLAMIKHKMEDYHKGSSKTAKILKIKTINDKIKLGEFKIGFFQVEHSIMDAVGVILETPSGTIIHPGDWTLEKDKNNRPVIDYGFLSRLPKPTVLLLESLGAIDVRQSSSDEEMKKNLYDLITRAPGRTVIGTFSSQIERIGWILSQAEKLNKKVALDGYSMKMNIEIAKELGYIKVKKHTLININQIDKYPDKEVIVLCTGAQGEGNAVLSRIIAGNHRHFKLRKTDTVILSSSIIPGNERSIQKLKDNLYRQCDNVIHGNIMDIHVSGHGNREDIKFMLKSIRPDYFMPVYANHYMLKEASKLAESIGFKKENIFVPDNGSVIRINKKTAKMDEKKVPANYVFVDGLGITDDNNIVLRDRQLLASDGMVVVIATIDTKTGQLVQNPDIISRGFVFLKENKELIEDLRHRVKKLVIESDPTTWVDSNLVRNKIRDYVGQFLFSKTEKRPMVLPVIIEV